MRTRLDYAWRSCVALAVLLALPAVGDAQVEIERGVGMQLDRVQVALPARVVGDDAVVHVHRRAYVSPLCNQQDSLPVERAGVRHTVPSNG